MSPYFIGPQRIEKHKRDQLVVIAKNNLDEKVAFRFTSLKSIKCKSYKVYLQNIQAKLELEK